MRFGILGVAGSNSVRLLLSNLQELQNCRSGSVQAADVDVVINYGMKGQRLTDWYRGNRRRAAFEGIPQINGAPAINKYDAVLLAARNNVPVPHTERHMDRFQPAGSYIFKPFFSQRGRGIVPAGTEPAGSNGYYQRMITNRAYEVRVVGATWYNEPWAVYKKSPGADMPADQIAWNHDQGGVFRRVNDISLRVFNECIQYTRTMLVSMGLQFGAADFIVDEDRNIYFIELNTRPGFTADYGIGYYVSMFERLLEQNQSEVEAILGQNTAIDRQEEGRARLLREAEAEAARIQREAEDAAARAHAALQRVETVNADLMRRLEGIITRWQDAHGVQYNGRVDQAVSFILSETTY